MVSAGIRLLVWAIVFVAVGTGEPVQAQSCTDFDGLLIHGAYGVADSRGQIVFGCHLDEPFVPASIIKMATVLAGFHLLGPDYRFRTEIYWNQQHDLFVRGYGDPTLVSEEVKQIARGLYAKGLRRVNRLFVDDSLFALSSQVPGREDSDNPYDAPVGAVSVNFNTVPFTINAAGVVASGERQTPTLPIMRLLARGRKAGFYRVNVCAGKGEPRTRMIRYTGELFAALLRNQGITVRNIGQAARKPSPGSRLVFIHHSRQTLREVSQSILYYSSNFMANLVYLNSGAARYGYPASWQKAKAAVDGELTKLLGSATVALIQEEGAGLSRANRVSVRLMLDVLAAFRPYRDLMRKEGEIIRKTGTMTGIYNYAGYLPGGYSFVLLLNQQRNTRKEILHRLQQRITHAGSLKE